MKKQLIRAVVIVLLLALALPAVASASQKSASLQDVYWLEGKGWVALFAVEGDWSNADLQGNQALVGDVYYDMDCAMRDDGKVACVVGGLGAQASRPAWYLFGGVMHQWSVPAALPEGSLECGKGSEMLAMKYRLEDGTKVRAYQTAPWDMYTIWEKRQMLHELVLGFGPIAHETLMGVECMLYK